MTTGTCTDKATRLVVELTHSFPSGHAMMSSILVCVVAAVIVRLTEKLEAPNAR